MPQAITTKSLAATNTRPTRIRAMCEGGSVTLSWDHGQTDKGNHDLACISLLQKLNWGGTWVGGWINGRCVVYVRNDGNTITRTEAR